MNLSVVIRLCAALLGVSYFFTSVYGQCEQRIAGDVRPIIILAPAASTIWDPDGAGTMEPVLVCSGSYASVGPLQNKQVVATWDGQNWTVLGGEITGGVQALAVFQGRLIAGGTFSKIGTASVQSIAAWNGTVWEGIGGTNAFVSVLSEYQGELIAAGTFSTAGGVSARRIASWNGTRWKGLATTGNPTIQALCEWGGMLIAGGQFTSIDGVAASSIAAFDGAWHPLGSGVAGSVSAVSTFRGELVAGGRFTFAGGTSAKNVARWNGTAWRNLDGGTNLQVTALREHAGALWVGGPFETVGSPPIASPLLASWDGTEWRSAGSGAGALGNPAQLNQTDRLEEFRGELIAIGRFQTPAFVSFAFARMYPFGWRSMYDTLNGNPTLVTAFGGRFVVGGNFLEIGGQPVHHLMQWSGADWQRVGEGLRSTPTGMSVWADRLIIGGSVPRSLPESSSRVSTWDGVQWSPLGNFDAGNPYHFTEYGGELIVGGTISPSGSIDARGVAAWNGTSWRGLGSGVSVASSQTIRAMCSFAGRLIVAGALTSAGGTPVDNMAAWNGSVWSHAGGGTTGPVNSMVVWNGNLIIGGEFLFAGVTPVVNAAAWSGGTDNWIPMNIPETVLQLAVWQGDLIARVQGGAVKRWNGLSWEAMDFQASAKIGVMEGMMAAGISPSEAIGPYALPRYVSGKPMLPTQPRDPVAYCGTSAALSVIVDNVGANTPDYVWRRGEIALSDGPTGTGSVLSGVGTATLRIENDGPADAGSYDVVVTNSCGTVTSLVAMVTPNCCPSDLDGNGIVEDADFAAFTIAYEIFACAAPDMTVDCPADFNRDGVVDDADFQVFVVGYGGMVCE